MSSVLRVLLNYGKPHRIWPYARPKSHELYVSVALVRPHIKSVCKLLVSRDHGDSWNELGDFYSIDRRNTTSGQPFLTSHGTLLFATWDAGFYTHGKMWLAIYRSNNLGASWEKVYEDPNGSYGKHFFEDTFDGSLYIGVGVGGGGLGGKVSSTPAGSYLLKSTDGGETWNKVLEINYPTAIYSGTVDKAQTIITAREKKSVFKSLDRGRSWTELTLGNTVRNVSFIKELNQFVVTSNDGIFVSKDGSKWMRINSPIRLLLRYPTFLNGKLFMTGVGWRSLVVSTDMAKWYVIFDATRFTDSNLSARMAIVDDYILIGDEINGMLLRIRLNSFDIKPLTVLRHLEYTSRYLFSIGKLAMRRLQDIAERR